MSENHGSTSAWTWLAVIVVPLLTLCLGGLTYWVRKLDDRQFEIVQEVVTRTDLERATDRLERRLEGLARLVVESNRPDHERRSRADPSTLTTERSAATPGHRGGPILSNVAPSGSGRGERQRQACRARLQTRRGALELALFPNSFNPMWRFSRC